MVQPIQYLPTTAADPFANLMQGMKLGLSMEEFEQNKLLRQEQAAAAQQQAALRAAQEREIQAKLDAQAATQTAIKGFMSKPFQERTDADYESLAMQLPNEMFQNLLKAKEARSTQENDNLAARYGQLGTALRSGNVDLAIQLAEQNAAAETNPLNRQGFELLAKTFKVAPQTAFDQLTTAMFKLGDKYATAAKTMFTLPGEMAKTEADTDKLRTETKVKQKEVEQKDIELRTLAEEKQAALAKAQSDAQIAATNASFAKRIAQAQLERDNAAAAQARASARLADAQAAQVGVGKPEFNKEKNAWIYPPTKDNPEGRVVQLPESASKVSPKMRTSFMSVLGVGDEGYAQNQDAVTQLIMQSTGSLAGRGVDIALGSAGFSTPGSKAAARLDAKVTEMTLLALDEKIGAGVSNADRDFMKARFGKIADPTVPTDEKLVVWNDVKKLLVDRGIVPPPGFDQAKPKSSGAAPSTSAASVTVQGKTYTRPANFTDDQWNAYKQAMGVR